MREGSLGREDGNVGTRERMIYGGSKKGKLYKMPFNLDAF